MRDVASFLAASSFSCVSHFSKSGLGHDVGFRLTRFLLRMRVGWSATSIAGRVVVDTFELRGYCRPLLQLRQSPPPEGTIIESLWVVDFNKR